MFEKPQNKKLESGPEQMADFAGKFAAKEASLDIAPKRAGTFLTLTLLALTGAMAQKSEAQVVGIGPQSWGGGSQVMSEVFGRVASGVAGAIDRQESAKKEQLERQYVARLTELGQQEATLDQDYSNKHAQIKPEDKQAQADLNNWYRTEKNRINETRTKLRQAYEKAKRPSAKEQILKGVIQSTRGW